MSDTKKPDKDVFDADTKKYNAALTPYATNIGAPVISTKDTITWKNRSINKLNHRVQTLYVEIKEQYEQLMHEFSFNQLIYNSKFPLSQLEVRLMIYTREKMKRHFCPLSHPINAILIQLEVSNLIVNQYGKK